MRLLHQRERFRRHPDVAWTKGPEDVRELAVLRSKLLRHRRRPPQVRWTIDLLSPAQLEPERRRTANCSPARAEPKPDAGSLHRRIIAPLSTVHSPSALTGSGELGTLPYHVAPRRGETFRFLTGILRVPALSRRKENVYEVRRAG